MFPKYKGAWSGGTHANHVVRGRCPGCGDKGTFDKLGEDLSMNLGGAPAISGQRVCPNQGCRTHVFFVHVNGTTTQLYPPEEIAIDSTDLPPSVLSTLREAVNCHAASCYRASAMMVRKTVEELCALQGLTSGNLKDKIAALSTKIVIPKDLLDGIDLLRLLGNDAAHINAKDFDDIGKDEVEAAIDVAKELLRATYQHKSLVGRLAAFKK